ncbi:uncharacterized protein KY384_008974 [Bacidia gigantensis]|uniref:uncharacterized protein n=1 Tax=Bacidia gigantensis TaxID=2732470 RepID=UPI001D056E01|nr:uncharacterized protein KY384_008974 [Bacidia gigantensis]KAG8525330.1 hypothetical protein KY384_008974 [Bacidia gigantensis]
MIGSARKEGGWHLETENPDHNHGPSDDLSQHPTLRRLTEEQLQRVHDMYDAGNTPSDTIQELRRVWPDIKILTRDIYNTRKKYKTQKELEEAAGGQSGPQPYTDPNGIMPGPDDRGRWAWIHDGDEITPKGRRRRKTVPAEHATLDPQLQTPTRASERVSGISSAHQQLVNASGDSAASLPYSLPGDSSRNALPSRGGEWMDPTRLNASIAPDPSMRPFDTNPESTTNGLVPESQVATASNTSPQISETRNHLESRLESLEKEQRETRSMLSQILGAVQGTGSSPQHASRRP